MLVFAFFGLILTSANYAIITGEEEDYAAGRAVSEAVFASGAFTVSGILVLYSIILLLDAVERRAVESPAAVEEGEDDFGRVKRHLSAITATVVAFVLIVMVSPAGRQYADVTGETAVDVVRWAVLLAQLAVATIVGIAYLRHHRRHGRAPAADWTGTSRFGLLCLGFVLASTLAGLWAGSLAPCDQVPWPAAAAAIALHGAIMAYASVVIGRPWLRPRS
jgi:TRAP-type C4-dicarboxylate transport system permease small subunit